MIEATRIVRRQRGVPVYDYRNDPATPPVSVLRSPPWPYDGERYEQPAQHIHAFPALWYSATGTVYIVAPGAVVDSTGIDTLGPGVAVFFDPAALGDDARGAWPTWRSHPLLYPFLHGRHGGLLQIAVPPERRPVWDTTIAAIETELAQRQDGYRQATCALLTLLLIDLARLAADIVGDLRRGGEPLLAEVFDVIDKRHGEELSLRDVARTVGMTPGHLTTLVRRRTGRTVQEWILQRRMSEARRLLSETELPIAEIARRVGHSDPGYFSRQFRKTFGVPPRSWRASRAG